MDIKTCFCHNHNQNHNHNARLLASTMDTKASTINQFNLMLVGVANRRQSSCLQSSATPLKETRITVHELTSMQVNKHILTKNIAQKQNKLN